ncbi:MAG: IS30 family transposase [Bacteroidetes bacterium]|nr:IS30 family transposase [Bacteroidota bacterium]
MRPYKQLSFSERLVIQKMKWRGESLRSIAKCLGRNVSTISREVKKNKSKDGFYRAVKAHSMAEEKSWQKALNKIEENIELMDYIIKKLKLKWSPEIISGRLKHDFPYDKTMRVSYETIYLWLYKLYKEKGIQTYKLLPRKRRKRRKREQIKHPRIFIEGKKSIHSRPLNAELRKEIGHWEGDTMSGKNHDGYIATLVDRSSRLLKADKMANKNADTCTRAIFEALGNIINDQIHTITFDNGTEFARFKTIEEAFECDTYFADPYSAWQRGTVEQTNGLIRKFLPKGTPFKNLNKETLDIIVEIINNTPRKILNYLTPYEIFYDLKPVALRI